MRNLNFRLILVGFIVLFVVLMACHNEPDVSLEISVVDVFAMDAKERQRRINALYQESLEMRSDSYIADSAGGYRVKALLLQLEFSILVYAEKNEN